MDIRVAKERLVAIGQDWVDQDVSTWPFRVRPHQTFLDFYSYKGPNEIEFEVGIYNYYLPSFSNLSSPGFMNSETQVNGQTLATDWANILEWSIIFCQYDEADQMLACDMRDTTVWRFSAGDGGWSKICVLETWIALIVSAIELSVELGGTLYRYSRFLKYLYGKELSDVALAKGWATWSKLSNSPEISISFADSIGWFRDGLGERYYGA